MQPTLGRIIHYVQDHEFPGHPYNGYERAAIITEVNADGTIDIQIFGNFPDGPQVRKKVLQDEEFRKAGTWHWPEKV